MFKPRRGQPQEANCSPVPHRAREQQRQHTVLLGSTWLRGRDERRRAKQDLRNGREPAPKYTTGKEWAD